MYREYVRSEESEGMRIIIIIINGFFPFIWSTTQLERENTTYRKRQERGGGGEWYQWWGRLKLCEGRGRAAIISSSNNNTSLYTGAQEQEHVAVGERYCCVQRKKQQPAKKGVAGRERIASVAVLRPHTRFFSFRFLLLHPLSLFETCNSLEVLSFTGSGVFLSEFDEDGCSHTHTTNTHIYTHMLIV
jgi:hypothetical protein